jgi:O-antigen/teichoic acid export membrane protein
VQKLVGFLLFMWLAHSLSVPAYATFGLLFALQTGLTALAGAGVVETIVGMLKSRATAEERATLFAAGNAVFVLFATVSVLIVAIGYGVLSDALDASPLTVVFVTVGGLATAYFILQSHLTRLEEAHNASLALSFFPPLLSWIVGFAAFSIEGTVSGLFAGVALALVLCIIPFWVTGTGFFSFFFRRDDVREILSRIAPFVLFVVLMWLSGYGNAYLIEALFTSGEVASYTFAYTLSSVMQLVATSLNQVWAPRFLRMIREEQVAAAEASSRGFFALQGVALGVIGGGVLALAPAAIAYAGPTLAHYRSLDVELFLLFSAYALSIPWYHVQNYYFAYGKGKELLHITLMTSAAGTVLWLGAMVVFGPIGIYMGFALLMGGRAIGTLLHARREWRIGVRYEGVLIALSLMFVGFLCGRALASLIPVS